MRGISDTIARFAAAAARTATPHDQGPGRLCPLRDFGDNPGGLRASVHIPSDLPENAPLVVVLHGCTQSAGGYDRASGWSQLADEQRFALLYPEQQRANNANNCFNWFEASDTRRDAGEALSIRQMIGAVQARHRIDPDRIFVTGLSAGGAMAGSLLATYPEIFAGGAIIAGLPYGVASGMIQAFDRMRGHGLPADSDLTKRVRSASDHTGPWPRISVWHGTADKTVAIDNAEALLAQWQGVHGLESEPTTEDQIIGARYRAWRDSAGRLALESYTIDGMGHGTPLRTTGPGAYGMAAPYMLDVGICSTSRIATFWGISQRETRNDKASYDKAFDSGKRPARVEPHRLRGRRTEARPVDAVASAARTIEDALRAAGLLK